MSTESSVRHDGKRRGRLYVAIGGLVLSVAYGYLAATTLPLGKPAQPGAAIFPIVVAVVMAGASLLLLFEQLALGAGKGDGALDFPSGLDLRRIAGTGLAIALYALLAGYLGNLVASFVMCSVIVRLTQAGSWRRVLITAAAIALATHFLFVLVFGVLLPDGIFK